MPLAGKRGERVWACEELANWIEERRDGLKLRVITMTNFANALAAFDKKRRVGLAAGMTFLHRMFDNDHSRRGIKIIDPPPL